MNSIILLSVLGAVAYRVASPKERERVLHYAKDFVEALKTLLAARREGIHEFRLALRARTPRPVVMPVFGAICILVFAGLLFGAAPMSDPEALLGWGASLGTRTTHGEWWRLATAMFVHSGMLQLIVDLAVLVQVGLLVERLVGRPVVAAVCVSAGIMTGIANLSSSPTAVTVSASGPFAALVGLLAAVVIAQYGRELLPRRKRAVKFGQFEVAAAAPETESDADNRIPMPEVKMLAIGGGIFLLYTAIASPAGLWGFAVGLGYGAMLAPLRGEEYPSPRRLSIAAAIAASVAAMFALPLRNIDDVKPEIARVIAVEAQTSKAYQTALDSFKKGRTTAEALARVAGGTNVSELEAVDARLAALEHVPPEHQGLVRDARDYLRLRCDAWRLRADAVRRMGGATKNPEDQPSGQRRIQAEARFRSNMVAMGRAESAERASMVVFERLRVPAATQTAMAVQ